jgi:hypothetical protein
MRMAVSGVTPRRRCSISRMRPAGTPRAKATYAGRNLRKKIGPPEKNAGFWGRGCDKDGIRNCEGGVKKLEHYQPDCFSVDKAMGIWYKSQSLVVTPKEPVCHASPTAISTKLSVPQAPPVP